MRSANSSQPGQSEVETTFIGQDEVPELLEMSECIAAVRDALGDLARGEGIQPLRPIMWLPERVGALGMMPGYLGSLNMMGIKTVTVFPGNADTELDSHQGTVMLFDAGNGRLLAVIDATEITAIRTAAASAVATDALARDDSTVMAILGAGVQGHGHLESIPLVRDIDEVRVWSRTRASAERLASMDERAHVVGTVAEAVKGADIVCTTSASPEPILGGVLLEDGMHLNAVGSSVPFARELDSAAMAACRLFVDRRESTLSESGDFLMARAEGAIADDHIVAEIGDVIIGSHPGRGSDTEITLFKSLGLAVEDIAAAHVVYRSAMRNGKGRQFEFGGLRHG